MAKKALIQKIIEQKLSLGLTKVKCCTQFH